MIKKSLILSIFLIGLFASVSVGQDTTTTAKQDLFENANEVESVDELESYIKSNKKLPGFMTKDEMEKTGMTNAQIQRKLIKAVKKLHCYVIELKKENAQLKKKVKKISDYLKAQQQQ